MDFIPLGSADFPSRFEKSRLNDGNHAVAVMIFDHSAGMRDRQHNVAKIRDVAASQLVEAKWKVCFFCRERDVSLINLLSALAASGVAALACFR